MGSKDPRDAQATTVVGGSGRDGADTPAAPSEDRYAVHEEVGRGGLGRVLRAEDKKLGRQIVIKQLLHRSPDLEERFRREALLSSRLEHPAIITIHDMVLDAAQPFYTMRLVSGRTLMDLIRERRTPRERLALLPHVVQVADAVAYAHSRGILHRDIKPANILVGAFGETVLIDWGLAKDMSDAEPDVRALPAPRAQGSGELTQAGDIIGTPAYMPPEQAAGQSVDERADIYAVGAVLYEVLTGRAPHSFPLGTSDLARLHEKPPPPVTVEAADTPADLAAIVAKAMAPTPEGRYATASELVADLKRFTTGQLVSVHRYSFRALVARWLRRHRLPVAIGALALVALAVVSTVGVARVIAERDRAEARANDLRVAQAQAVGAKDPTSALAWLAAADYDAARFRTAIPLAMKIAGLGVAHDVLVTDRATVHTLAASPDRRHAVLGDERGLVIWEIATRHPTRVAIDDGPVVALDVQGEQIAAATRGGRVFLVDLQGRKHGGDSRHQGTPVALAIARDRQRVAVLTAEGSVDVRVPDGQVSPIHRQEGGAVSIAWSPAGELAWSSAHGEIAIWGEARHLSLAEPDGTLASLVWVGDRLVAARGDGQVGVWAGSAFSWRGGATSGHRITILTAAPGGEGVVSAGAEGNLYWWPMGEGPPRKLDWHGAMPMSAAVSPRATWWASGAADGEVRVGQIDPASRFLTERRLGHTGLVVGMAFLDEDRLVSAGREGELRLWSLADASRARGFLAPGPVQEVAFLEARKELVGITRTGTVWRVPQDGSTPVTIGQVGGDAMLAVSPDGEWIAAAGDRILRVWPAAGGEPRALEGHTQNTYSVAFSPDSTQLVSTGEDNRAFLWRLADGTAKELPHGGLAFDAVFSPDSRYVAVAGTPADVKVWTLDGALVRVLPGHARGARRLSWSATGRLATAGLDGVIRVFEPAVDGKAHFSLAANDPFFAVALSSDGSRVVACGMEGQVFHWKLGSPAERLIGHTGNVYAVVFSPDGSQIATASQDGTVRLWHAESRVARVLSFERPVKRLAFSPDGKTLAAGDEGGTVRLWPISDGDLPATPAELHQWIRARTSAEIDESGRPRSP